MADNKVIAIIGSGGTQCLPTAIQRALRESESKLTVSTDLQPAGSEGIGEAIARAEKDSRAECIKRLNKIDRKINR